jgi:hypothetical protein
MKTWTNTQRAIILVAIWLVSFFVLWLLWFAVGPENQWWTTAIYAVVLSVAVFCTLWLPPVKPDNGTEEQS